MSDPGILDTASNRLRTAIDAGEYEEAQELLAQYCIQVEAVLRSLDGDTVGIDALRVKSKRMFEWAHNAVSTGRAETAAELERMRSNRSYAGPGPAGLKTWELDG